MSYKIYLVVCIRLFVFHTLTAKQKTRRLIDYLENTMRRTIEDRKTALIGELIDAHQSLIEAAQALPPEKRDEVFLGTWCIKDLVAHLVGWDETNLQAVQEILSGQEPGFFLQYDKDWQSYNAKLVNNYGVEPFEALLAEVTDSHARWIGYLRSLPAQDVVYGKGRSPRGRTITVRNLLVSEAGDERKHKEQVEAFIKECVS